MIPSDPPVALTEVLPDDETLRIARRERVLGEMEANGIDILVTGREGNARYISGAPRLWTAGSHPFGPGCVLVRATGAVHLLSTWDEGVPEEIPHEQLYGISFNSANMQASLRRIEGASTARIVATDGMTPSSAQMLAKVFPVAELIDGEPLLRRARRVKLPQEVAAIRAAVGVAEHALAEASASLAPGVTGRQLTGGFMEAMAAAGVTTPATQDVAWITSSESRWGRGSRDSAVRPGDLVAFAAGVIRAGYAGELGTTVAVSEGTGRDRGLRRRLEELCDRLVSAFVAGAPLSDLLMAYESAGEPLPPFPIARGLGLGFDLPIVTGALPATAASQRAEAGMVAAITAYVWEEGVGALYLQEPVHLTEQGPALLSSAGSGE